MQHVGDEAPLLGGYGGELAAAIAQSWHRFDGGLVETGYDGEGFCFDNELPRHRVFLEPFELAGRLVTNGEFAAFINEDGYRRPELWLADGWDAVHTQHWRAPPYWLERDGQLFVHIFCHRSTPYEFLDQGDSDWMSRHFFSGGIMPSDDLPLRFQDRLQLHRRWRWNGRHYERTANAWLANMDARRAEVMPVLARTYGEDEAQRWWMRWRIFLRCFSRRVYSGLGWSISSGTLPLR